MSSPKRLTRVFFSSAMSATPASAGGPSPRGVGGVKIQGPAGEPRANERTGDMRTRFGEHRVDAMLAEPAHRGTEVETAVGAWECREQHACLAKLVRAPRVR